MHGIKLRTNPLIVGPSGVGKTWIAEDLARELKLPIFKVTCGDWLPQGVQRETPTLNRLRDFIKCHPRYVLHIDELDKYRATEGGPAQAGVRTFRSRFGQTNENRLNRSRKLDGLGGWECMHGIFYVAHIFGRLGGPDRNQTRTFIVSFIVT